MVEVANYLFNTSILFFNSLMSDWGIIGIGVISTFLLVRVVNFIRRFFK